MHISIFIRVLVQEPHSATSAWPQLCLHTIEAPHHHINMHLCLQVKEPAIVWCCMHELDHFYVDSAFLCCVTCCNLRGRPICSWEAHLDPKLLHCLQGSNTAAVSEIAADSTSAHPKGSDTAFTRNMAGWVGLPLKQGPHTYKQGLAGLLPVEASGMEHPLLWSCVLFVC